MTSVPAHRHEIKSSDEDWHRTYTYIISDSINGFKETRWQFKYAINEKWNRDCMELAAVGWEIVKSEFHPGSWMVLFREPRTGRTVVMFAYGKGL